MSRTAIMIINSIFQSYHSAASLMKRREKNLGKIRYTYTCSCLLFIISSILWNISSLLVLRVVIFKIGSISLLLVNNLDSCTLVRMHAKGITGGFAGGSHNA